jgi:pimeloyl-ACP methyl ester carboxylesterase
MQWRSIHLPDTHWAPRGLPGSLRSMPGSVARLAAESRFAVESAEFATTLLTGPGSLREDLPEGAGRGVLVIPGFGFGDASTLPLQVVLGSAGFRVFRSGIVWNVDCSDLTVERLVGVAERAAADNGGPLLVVGHSRGGMLARGLAVRRPDLVSRVISMGAPLNYEFAFYEIPAPLVGVLRWAHHRDPARRELRCSTPECACPYLAAAHRPLPAGIDLFSLYTASDGIVDWRACVVPGATNIEVGGSHLGMGLNPATLQLILRLLCEAPATAR